MTERRPSERQFNGTPEEARAWGREGARRRWGDHVPRVVRLDGLTSDQRQTIIDLVDELRSAKVTTPDGLTFNPGNVVAD